MGSDDVEALLESAVAAQGAGEHREALALLTRARRLGAKEAQVRQAGAASEEAAQAGVARWLPIVRANVDGTWIDEFLVFRAQFEHATCAAELMQLFLALRAVHDPVADDLNKQAREAFQRGDTAGGYVKYQEIVNRAYASRRYVSVKRWIAERK
ncbi:MAG: hypothetical protein O2894_04510 [Planctomycetota bacterium]|nr:hypothetical protein [Planctomycetota bacterium]